MRGRRRREKESRWKGEGLRERKHCGGVGGGEGSSMERKDEKGVGGAWKREPKGNGSWEAEDGERIASGFREGAYGV